MFSNKTLLQLIKIIDSFRNPEVDRIISIFNFTPIQYDENLSVKAKATRIFNDLRYSKKVGPFSDDIHLDLLQYLIDDFFHKNHRFEIGVAEYHSSGKTINFLNAFLFENIELGNCLKRDGFIISGKTIRKLLPQEIEESKIESELFISLNHFDFSISTGHLNQAISNHSQGNWAGANSQFRTFIESLLIEISKYLIPSNIASTASQAIKLLAESVSPPFLSKTLNEVPSSKDNDSFVYGLWARLHPNGSHPGLSDEEDCSFRYHTTIVFAQYLLSRLRSRINNI